MATALLKKHEVEQPAAVEAADSGVTQFHWTVDAYYRAYDAGAFGYSKRLELIQGRIIEKMPPGPHHSYLADAIAHRLRVALEPPFLVREEKAVHIAFDSEPIPDITIVSGERADYHERHPMPGDVALLVEVADTTVANDLGDKALLYAQAGVTDYWVALVNEAVVVVHREPTPEGYQSVTRLAGTDTISPLVMPETVWTINALLGHGGTSEED